jgi:hypothetical protein
MLEAIQLHNLISILKKLKKTVEIWSKYTKTSYLNMKYAKRIRQSPLKRYK